MKPRRHFAVGDIVRHTGAFLRSIGMVTAPINGIVREVQPRDFVRVEWSDGVETWIKRHNLERDPRHK